MSIIGSSSTSIVSETPDSAHWQPNEGRNLRAREAAHTVLNGARAEDDLAEYYRWEGGYAGATFSNLQPNRAGRLTGTDLLAATTLSVDVKPMAVRRVTDPEVQDQLSTLLAELGTDLHLTGSLSGETTQAMGEFYLLVKAQLRRAGATTSNAWVTASKICARKRPHLFPVRDSVVAKVLGLPMNYPEDWPIFAALMQDAELMFKLDSLVTEAGSRDGVDVGDTSLRLRHLDVLLWMHGIREK